MKTPITMTAATAVILALSNVAFTVMHLEARARIARLEALALRQAERNLTVAETLLKLAEADDELSASALTNARIVLGIIRREREAGR